MGLSRDFEGNFPSSYISDEPYNFSTRDEIEGSLRGTRPNSGHNCQGGEVGQTGSCPQIDGEWESIAGLGRSQIL